MILTLEVASPPGRELPASRRMVFRASGGTIGRTAVNDWVLPDPYVSSRHALIVFLAGQFHLEDTSTNGVFINSTDNRVGKGKRAVLKTGDLILIDPYEIRVSIEEEQVTGPGVGGLLGDDPFGPQVSDGGSGHFGLLDPVPSVPSAGPRAGQLGNKSPLSDHYRPPAPVPQAGPSSSPNLVPEDWDRSLHGVPAPQLVHEPTPPAAAAPVRQVPPPNPVDAPQPVRPNKVARSPIGEDRASADFSAILAGAGLGNLPVSAEVAQDFGKVLRVVVAGLMDILQSRQGIKSEFRMQVTSFQASQNNPLKFSANVEDALHNLLVKRNPAYLATVDAFEDAFDDLRNHQMAMLHGIRVAFDEMLKSFDPDRLQKEFDRKGKGSLISVPAKLRYWDQYRDKFGDMVTDADACFRDLFGEEFAKAYEEQLEQLKPRKGPRRPRS